MSSAHNHAGRRLAAVRLHLQPVGASTTTTVGPEPKKKSRYEDLQTCRDEFYNICTLQQGQGDRDLLAAVEQVSTASLAAASAPLCMHYDTPAGEIPLLWGRHEWETLTEQQHTEPIFDMKKVQQQFDRVAFERDGYVAWEGIMTSEAQVKWTAALQRCQELNDRLVMADWRTKLDWSALGVLPHQRSHPPTTTLTQEERQRALGSGQFIPQSTDETGVRTLRQNGVLPEYCCFAHVAYLAFVLTHPQMLALQRLVLGSEPYFGTSQLNNKAPGYSGGGWHSHPIGGGIDSLPMTRDLAEYHSGSLCSLTLAYPEGFQAGDDGNISIIRGSHLWRDPEGCRSAAAGEVGNAEMEAGWLRGKAHPITGADMVIEQLVLPPGSLVTCTIAITP